MKKSLIYIFLITLTFIITSCLDYEQRTNINKDGDGRMHITYRMKLPVDSVLIKSLFNEDTLKASIKKTFTSGINVKVTQDTVKDSVMIADLEFSFNSVDSLNQITIFANSNYSYKDGAPGQKIFTQFIPPVTTGFGFIADSFYVMYSYKFKGEIIAHNATAQKEDELIWKYKLDEIGKGKTITATLKPYKINETPTWIYVMMGVVLLSVIIFLFRKKKD